MATPSARMLDVLSTDDLRAGLVRELKELTDEGSGLSVADVAVILGQWRHPLHYFPVFLSRLVSVAPTIEMQAVISRILWQELGQGDPDLAHENIYIETMTDAGFDVESIVHSPPLEATAALVRGYQRASSNYVSGLGYLYGTEVADLSMVSSIGRLVSSCTGARDLPWVRIHIEQEPDHVETSSRTLLPVFSPEEQSQVVTSAREMWRLWVEFFAELKQRVLQ